MSAVRGQRTVVSSSSPGKTVSGMPYDRIRSPSSMTPMNAATRPFFAYTADTSVRVPCSLGEVTARLRAL